MIRIATIGTGNIVRSFLGAVKLLKYKFTLTTVCSRTLERGKAFGEEFGCTDVTTDLNVLAKRKDVDAVYIASPNSLHFEHALLMLKNKKHVLLEKPAVVTTEQLLALHKAAEENGVVILEAIIPMFVPARQKVKEAVEKIGKVHLAKFQYCQYSSRYDDFKGGKIANVFSREFAGGALMDLGVYCIYPAIDLFGIPNKITAKGEILDTGVDSNSALIMEYDDKLVSIVASKNTQSDIPSEILGEKGNIRFGMISRYEDIDVCIDGETENIEGTFQKEESMSYEVDFFYNLINNFDMYKEDYLELLDLSLKVCAVLEKTRKIMGLQF